MTLAVDWDVKHQFKQTNVTNDFVSMPGFALAIAIFTNCDISENLAQEIDIICKSLFSQDFPPMSYVFY